MPLDDAGVQIRTSAFFRYSSANSGGVPLSCIFAGSPGRPRLAMSPCGSTIIAGIPSRIASSITALQKTVFPDPLAPNVQI